MKIRKGTVLLLFVAWSLVGLMGFEPAEIVSADCGAPHPAAADCASFKAEGAGSARNVILLIGDGMGLSQIYAGRVKVNGPDHPFAFETLPDRGLATTCSESGITDSAAASTALNSGHKTRNGMIDTGPEEERFVNIADFIHARRAVGVVTTVRVWDATPAGAVAHASLRSQRRSIAQEMVTQTRPEVIMGGGASAYLPNASPFARSELDRLDMVGLARDEGYSVVRTAAELQAQDLGRASRLLGLFALEDMAYELDRKPDSTEPHLSEMAAAALDVLDNDPRGFFALIEGGAIDHACHGTDLDRMLGEVAEFNRTVDLALAYAASHPDTLVIVTADHETGGMEIVPKNYRRGDRVEVKWHSQIVPGKAGHSSQKVGVFAYGPNAAAIRPEMENTEIFCVIRNAFGD